MTDLSAREARRIAIAAQGLATARPRGPVGARRVLAAVERMSLLQLDSVTTLVRSHYLPLFARLGSYQRGLLDGLAYDRRVLFESWAHEASLLPVELEPLLRWRKARALASPGTGDTAQLVRDYPWTTPATSRRCTTRSPGADRCPPGSSATAGRGQDPGGAGPTASGR